MSKSKAALVPAMILPPQAEREAKSLMTPDQAAKINKAKFILAMPQQERELLLGQVHSAYAARMLEGVSGLAFGAHLLNIQEITKKYRTFLKTLRLIGGISHKTALRYIEGYQNASTLPQSVVKAMILKGMTITPTPGQPLGKYTQAVRYLPAPKGDDPEKAKKYVQQVEEYTKEKRSRSTKQRIKKSKVQKTTGDPQLLLETTFRSVYPAINRLPESPKVRRKFLDSLVGMLMSCIGLQSAQQFVPEAIPERFVPKRGRPVLVGKDEEEKKDASMATGGAA